MHEEPPQDLYHQFVTGIAEIAQICRVWVVNECETAGFALIARWQRVGIDQHGSTWLEPGVLRQRLLVLPPDGHELVVVRIRSVAARTLALLDDHIDRLERRRQAGHWLQLGKTFEVPRSGGLHVRSADKEPLLAIFLSQIDKAILDPSVEAALRMVFAL